MAVTEFCMISTIFCGWGIWKVVRTFAANMDGEPPKTTPHTYVPTAKPERYTQEKMPDAEVEVKIKAIGGMYRTKGSINGKPVKFLVDTGATYVSMDTEQMEYIGGKPGDMRWLNTANGKTKGYEVDLDEVRVGEIVVRNVMGNSSDGMSGMGGEILLGMSFLNEIEMNVDDDVMTLTQTDSERAAQEKKSSGGNYPLQERRNKGRRRRYRPKNPNRKLTPDEVKGYHRLIGWMQAHGGEIKSREEGIQRFAEMSGGGNAEKFFSSPHVAKFLGFSSEKEVKAAPPTPIAIEEIESTHDVASSEGVCADPQCSTEVNAFDFRCFTCRKSFCDKHRGAVIQCAACDAADD